MSTNAVVETIETSRAAELPMMSRGYRFAAYALEFGVPAALVATFVLFGVLYGERFLNKFNLVNALGVSVAFTIIVAVGVMLALIAGQVDVSGGGQMVFGSLLFAGLVVHTERYSTVLLGPHVSLPLAVLITVAVILAFGAFNGFLVVNLGIYSILATFPMSLLLIGLMTVMSGDDGGDFYLLPDTPAWNFVYHANDTPLGVPLPIYMAVVVTLAAWVILEKTRFGAHLRAAGGNPSAALRAGIPVARMVRYVFLISSLTVVVATYIVVGQNGVGGATVGTAGGVVSFDGLTVALIGGAGLAGGFGRIDRMLIGALLLAVIGNGLTLSGLDVFVRGVVSGFILIFAVISSSLARKRLARGS